MMLQLKVIAGIVLAAVVGGAAYWYFSAPQETRIACTLEAKLCPDGSYVGRTGPNCEFAACPSATSTTGGGTGAGGGTGGILPYNSGVHGIVLLGPTCPVERIPPDPNCADRPYQTLVAIFRASDPVHAVAIMKSNASGTFAASLPPGEYSIGAGESNLPRCAMTTVTVEPGVYASTTVFCDTGIR